MTEKQASARWMKLMKSAGDIDLNGYRVEAVDGDAGRIEQVLFWSDAKFPDYVVVETGRWLFGHKSVLSIHVIDDVDMENRSLKIRLSKRQIRKAPEFLPCT